MILNRMNNDTYATIVINGSNPIPIALSVEQAAAHLTCRDHHFPVGSCSGLVPAAGRE